MHLHSFTPIFFLLFSSSLFADSELNHTNQFSAQSHNSKTSVLLIRLNTSGTNNKIKDLDHLMEHLLFKGTQKHPKYNGFMSFLVEQNISSNAITSNEYIDFYYKINNDILEFATLRIMSQFNSPLFSPEQIKKELIPFKEELLKNKLNIYPKLSQCLYNQSHDLKFNSSIYLLDENDISKHMQHLYKQTFKPDNLTFFLWSSQSQVTLKGILAKAVNNLPFSNNTLKNDKLTEDPSRSTFAFCEEANSPKNNLFHLTFDLKDYFIEEDISFFFSLILSKKGAGSFIHQLKENTHFKSVSFMPFGNSLTVSFSAKNEYSIDDVIKAKLMFYEYLNMIIDNKLTNEIKHSVIADYLYPLERTYHYSEIIKKFNQTVKNPFEGESLYERLASLTKYLLLQNQDWAISLKLKDQFNSSIDMSSYEKHFASSLSTDFSNDEVNPFLPSPNFDKDSKDKALNTDFKKLTHITPIYSVQYNKTKLVSLILQIETIDQNDSKLLFSLIKKHFMEQNKDILNTLTNAYVDFSINSNNSLNLLVISYHANFSMVLKEIMSRLQSSLLIYNKEEDYSARMLLTGNVNKSTIDSVSAIVFEYFAVKIDEHNKMDKNNNFEQSLCGINCIAFPLSFIDKNEAHAFGKILQRLSANRFFHEIRFNKAVSYDANVVLYYKDNTPEIRITVSNSEVDLTDYINDYFINVNKKLITSQENEFNNAKQKLIDNLDNKKSFFPLVKHYWKELIKRSQISQGIMVEKEQIKKLNFDRFIEILNKLTHSPNITK